MMHKCFGALLAAILVLTACTSTAHDEQPMAAAVTFTDQWVSSAESGMAPVFGTVHNDGRHDATIVSGRSPSAGRVEVHEVAPDPSGAKVMRPKAGGLIVSAGRSHDLVPGGDHLMLMDLTGPLQPGADVSLTVVFGDGSTLPVTAQVRDFAGANEEYQPSAAAHDHG